MHVIRKTGYVIRNTLDTISQDNNTHQNGDLTHQDEELERLRRKYLKGYGDIEVVRDQQELAKLLDNLTNLFIDNYEIDPRVPYRFRESFEKDMRNFCHELASDLAEIYQNALEDGAGAEESLQQASEFLSSGAKRLAGKLEWYDREFDTYIVLFYQADQGYSSYLFMSERANKTCDLCRSQHGKIFSLRNLVDDNLIPPLHPNCKCEMIVMDARTEFMYNMNSESFLNHLETAVERRENNRRGGVYLLDHGFYEHLFFTHGIASSDLSRLTDRFGGVLANLSKPFWYLNTQEAYMFPDVVGQAKELLALMQAAREYRSEHKFDSFGNFLDWLTLGIPSGM